MTAPKKLFIKTYGCQMNVYDSERMAEALGGQGYVETKTPDDADMILMNTCHIREKAAEKVYSELGRFKALKTAKPDLKIGVAGCVAQAEGAEIMRRQPAVDLVVGPQSYHRLPEMDAKVQTGEKALDTDFPFHGHSQNTPLFLPSVRFGGRWFYLGDNTVAGSPIKSGDLTQALMPHLIA